MRSWSRRIASSSGAPARPLTRSSGLRALTERAVAFERDNLALAAGLVEEHPLGRWLRSAGHPGMWAMNQLYVEGPHPGLTAPGLCAELDLGLADAGHRRAIVTHDATGRRLADGMQAAGYSVSALGVMVSDREPPAPPRDRARELTEDEHRALEARIVAADPEIPAADHPVILEGHAHMREVIPGTRSFGGLAAGEPVCQTTLFCRAGTGQPEDVETMPGHRGRGIAAATVALATREAVAAGCDLVFVLCALATGPVALYADLGYRLAGRLWTFNRPA